jgi:hypothetical protein
MEARVGVIHSGGTGSVGADGAEGDWLCRRGGTELVILDQEQHREKRTIRRLFVSDQVQTT